MGWAIAGGVLGLVLMFVVWRWLVGWLSAQESAFSIPTIGSRPRRLAGVPEEAPLDAKTPPAMEVLRYATAEAAASTTAELMAGSTASAELPGPSDGGGQPRLAREPQSETTAAEAESDDEE